MTGPTLLAVAHGSRNPAARVSVDDLLAEVHRQRPEIESRAAFLDHAEPTVEQVLRALHGPVVAVPLLLTAAFHTDVDLPPQLATASVQVTQACALGPHALLLRALERRLGEAGVAVGNGEVAVVLAAAGSSDPRAVATVAALAAEWSAAGWWDVVPAYASAASPTPPLAVAALRERGAPRVAVASYLLSPGLFADSLHSNGADVVSSPLGAAPEVAAVVIERYDDARVRAGTGGRSPSPIA
ncbi:MAG: sirohydrochlorin chelatase [Actinomycetes bacterium]